MISPLLRGKLIARGEVTEKDSPQEFETAAWAHLADAFKKDNVKIIGSLLKNGADIDLRNDFGDRENHTTLLERAIKAGDVKMAETLLENGANPNTQDGRGNTPLHYAAIGKDTTTCKKMINLLSGAGAEFNIKNNAGDLPSDFANKDIKTDLRTIESAERQEAKISSAIQAVDLSAPPEIQDAQKKLQFAQLELRGLKPNQAEVGQKRSRDSENDQAEKGHPAKRARVGESSQGVGGQNSQSVGNKLEPEQDVVATKTTGKRSREEVASQEQQPSKKSRTETPQPHRQQKMSFMGVLGHDLKSLINWAKKLFKKEDPAQNQENTTMTTAAGKMQKPGEEAPKEVSPKESAPGKTALQQAVAAAREAGLEKALSVSGVATSNTAKPASAAALSSKSNGAAR